MKELKMITKEERKYYLCFSGIALAGMGAENQIPAVIYGTKQEAETFAYDESASQVDSQGVVDEREEDDHFEETVDDYVDYYAKVLNQEDLDNWGKELKESLDHEITLQKHDHATVYNEYGLTFDS